VKDNMLATPYNENECLIPGRRVQKT
jgi:hypothetical protein